MRKIHWILNATNIDDDVILDDEWDDADEGEIDDYIYDCVMNYISWGWEEEEVEE